MLWASAQAGEEPMCTKAREHQALLQGLRFKACRVQGQGGTRGTGLDLGGSVRSVPLPHTCARAISALNIKSIFKQSKDGVLKHLLTEDG